MNRGILSRVNICPHPPEARMENPKRPSQTLCGRCGAVVQGLDEQLMADTIEQVRKDVRRK